MKSCFLLLSILLLSHFTIFAAPPAEEGKIIFTSRCAGCHNVNKLLTGPALAGVEARHSLDWIISFVQSSQTVIQKGDQDAVALFAKFNQIPMPDHRDLTGDNIKSILAYIKSATVSVTDAPPFSRPSKLRPAYLPLSANDYPVFIVFGVLIILLIMSLIFMVKVKALAREIEKVKNDEKES